MIEDAASFDDDEEDYGDYQVCVCVCVGRGEGGYVFPWKYAIIWC